MFAGVTAPEFLIISASFQAVQPFEKIVVVDLHTLGLDQIAKTSVLGRRPLYGLPLHFGIGPGVDERGLELRVSEPL